MKKRSQNSLRSRRKFMASAAAMGAGVYLGGPRIVRSEDCTGPATGPSVGSSGCLTTPRSIHDIVHSYSTATTKRAGTIGQNSDPGDYEWTIDATYSGSEATKYHYSIVEEKHEGTGRIYFHDFGFNLSGPGTTKIKGLFVGIKARSFKPNGTPHRPKGDHSVRILKDATDWTPDGSLGGGYERQYHVTDEWEGDWTEQPWHVGKELWIGDNDATAQERIDFGITYPCAWPWQQQYGSSILRLTVDDVNDSDFGVVVYCNSSVDEHKFEIYDCPTVTVLV